MSRWFLAADTRLQRRPPTPPRILPQADTIDHAAVLRLRSGSRPAFYTGCGAVTPVAASAAVWSRPAYPSSAFPTRSWMPICSSTSGGVRRRLRRAGIAGAFVVQLVVQYTGVVGLPLY